MTEKQTELLLEVGTFTQVYGYPPTLRELANRLKLSQGAVRGRLAGLARVGAVHIAKRVARGITLAKRNGKR